MSDERTGHIISVAPRYLGSTAAVAMTATGSPVSVLVDDAGDFDPAGGVVCFPDHLDAAGLPITATYTVAVNSDEALQGITLTSLPVSLAAEDRVVLFDEDHGQPAVEYVAQVRIDGDDDGDPLPALVDQGLLPLIAQGVRADAGESVTVRRDDGEWRVVAVHGKRVTLEQVLQLTKGGLTTRANNTGAGVVLDATGFTLYDDDDNQIMRIGAPRDGVDVLDEGGFFVYQLVSGRLVVQLNTGTSRDQPSIQADPAGTGANLMLFSGASTLGRESWALLNQGSIVLGIEETPDSGIAGSQFILNRTDVDGITEGGARLLANADTLLTQSEYHNIGGTTLASIVYGTDLGFTAGYRTSGGAHIEGLQVAPGGHVQLMSVDDVWITTAGSGSWQNLTCKDVSAQGDITAIGDLTVWGTFSNPSDPKLKTDVAEPPDALEIIVANPSMQWRFTTDPEGTVRVYPMAPGLPEWLTQTRKDPSGADVLTVDSNSMVGLLWSGMGQQQSQIAALTQQVADLTARLDQMGA